MEIKFWVDHSINEIYITLSHNIESNQIYLYETKIEFNPGKINEPFFIDNLLKGMQKDISRALSHFWNRFYFMNG